MSKGLKQMVAEAMTDEVEDETPEPVEVSGEAHHELSRKIRQWSGWSDATLVLGPPPSGSPWACVDHTTHQIHLNVDELLLNPNRVLLAVTPFRLKQEAVLTGAALHETAGHARNSKWVPRDHEAYANWTHDDGTKVSAQTIALARLMEEPRVEGCVARDAHDVGAGGLAWTMRAAMAALTPMSTISIRPEQVVMDVLSAWALRAGKQIGMALRLNGYTPPTWVGDFTSLLNEVVTDHLSTLHDDAGRVATLTSKVLDLLVQMIVCDDNTGDTMIDAARYICEILFPETDGDDPNAPLPMAAPCGAGSEDGEGSDLDPDMAELLGEEGDESDSDSEGGTGEGADGDESDDQGEGDPKPGDFLQEALNALEQQANGSGDSAEKDMAEAEKAQGAGKGEGGSLPFGYRVPTVAERGLQHDAEKFLRKLIEPNESSIVSLTDSPSAVVNGAELAAWKAGGMVREPRFFVRTRRVVNPSPPVKIAILVDISISMNELATPSSVLSWAAASAAVDLRNFAGRGVQIESTLVHWGDNATVIQPNGKSMAGILQHSCNEGTSAMHEAMALVEQQIPGFFDISEKPEHRLLVQFTDWALGMSDTEATPWVHRALEAGVHMMSVVPKGYQTRYSSLPKILTKAPKGSGAGTTHLMRYDPKNPGEVWAQTAELLR